MIYAFLILVAGGMAWVRLAPDDPARWHGAAFPIVSAASDPVALLPGGALAVVRLPGASAVDALARLDAVALATPRTRRLAGSAAEGRITWVTRSAFFGFPDYTTAVAKADGNDTTLTIYARLRYGRRDFGVNAARLRDWLARMAP